MEPESTVRDKLAIQRNKLANERTILAYVRTALSFVGFGILVLRMFPEPEYFYIAIISIVLGIIVMLLGVKSYTKHKRKIS